MKLPPLALLPLALVIVAALEGCAMFTPTQPPASPTEPAQELADSRALVRRYESRFGKLQAERPRHDFRKLRAQLKGKPGSAVTALLGKPDRVYSQGTSESWDYMNAVYDPVSGRTVRTLEVWFRSGVVEYLKAL